MWVKPHKSLSIKSFASLLITDIEVRRYAAYAVAEIKAAGPADKVGN